MKYELSVYERNCLDELWVRVTDRNGFVFGTQFHYIARPLHTYNQSELETICLASIYTKQCQQYNDKVQTTNQDAQHYRYLSGLEDEDSDNMIDDLF